jgi:hypothetical protein
VTPGASRAPSPVRGGVATRGVVEAGMAIRPYGKSPRQGVPNRILMHAEHSLTKFQLFREVLDLHQHQLTNVHLHHIEG